MTELKPLKVSIVLIVLFANSIFCQDESLDSLSAFSNYAGGPVVRFASEELVNLFDYGSPFMKGLLNKRVTLNTKNSHLMDILNDLAEITKANFVYNDQLVDITDISLQAENERLENVLDKLLGEFDIGYTIINKNNIVLAHASTIQKRTGGIIGKVTGESNEPLMGANLIISENKLGTATDLNGYYEISNLKPGSYTVKASFVGYHSQTIKVIVEAGKKTELNFVLKVESFEIGGIKVIGSSELLPTDPNTKTKITGGEIEHYQATSLGDVLDIVPGIQKTANPGLNKTLQAVIRNDSYGEGEASRNLSAFGTQVIIDGAVESNNANLQFEVANSGLGGSTLSRGIDLRTIPADNIESVEVITGLPSVRYGDFTEGIIKLETKIGARPHRIKFKNNPHTSEGNLGGGISFDKDALSYNLNIARSERDARLEGDEYTRYTGQLVYSSLMLDNRLKSNFKLFGQLIHDEEEPKGDLYRTKNYNRGFSIGLNTWGKYKPADRVSSINYNVNVKMKRINSKKSRLVQSDLRILPTGDTVSTYTGAVKNRGIEWTIGNRLEWENVFFTGPLIHKFLVGSQLQYDDNNGQGIVLDTLYNYYGANSRRRSRSFDDIPGQLLWSLYFEDKITGNFLLDFSFMFGFRYEMYRPYAFNIKGLWGDGDLVKSHQGSFFNPRLNFVFYFSEDNQLRLSAGRTSKSPPMNLLYPGDEVFQWRNPVDSTINYFSYDRTSSNLKGYKETHYEASYDHKFFNRIGTTLSAYYKERSNQPSLLPQPVFVESVSEGKTQIFYVDEYNIDKNIGKSFSKGIEFSIRTAKIKPLNMNFTVVGSYNYSNRSSVGYFYDPYPDESKGQFPNYQVPNASADTLIGWTYPKGGRWSDRIQLNYYLKYTHPELGLWVTIRAEQLLKERSRRYNIKPIDYDIAGESDIEKHKFDQRIITKPNKWLFSINVSKSLFAGAEISFYVNNFLDDPAIRRYRLTPTQIREEIRNPDLFYGIEFSMMVDKIID